MSPMPDNMNNPEIVLATRNPGKLREIREVLAEMPVTVVGLDEVCDVPEPEETGATFAENAIQKALYYAKATGKWCLADDSGLVVDALNGAPGVHSARYAADGLPPSTPRDIIDQANNDKLLDALSGVSDENRSARFICHLALARGEDILLQTNGKIEGRIGHAPAGDNGFGYDPIFCIPQLGCSTAQLPPQQKNFLSHRGLAVRQFAMMLQDYLVSL